MALTSGTHLGPYEITAAIGAGGMGEVYRARDPKLGRDVAIKVLPELFARDAERMARFQREAKVLASLDHPNIASIYGLEDSGGMRALVMQLIEGPTLADRIKAGPIPVDEAVRIARQIADALEYAHERGIIHRDLKPANVKVTNDDAVKVLDFGLAKALEGDMSSIDISTSPTISRMATQQGVLLGTAAYMSPEQAKAKPVDRRADIWAFGCVLYEMLTATTAFQGEAVTDTLASVIKEEPNWNLLPSAMPMRVRVLLQRCLQKDPKQRLRDIGDARISLDEVLSGSPEPLTVASQALRPARLRALPWALFGATAVGLAALAFVHFGAKPVKSDAAVQRFEIAAPDVAVNMVDALSPDGAQLILGSGVNSPGRLWLRRMDSLDARPLESTDGAFGIPFWSPDSHFIAFGANGKLKKIDTEGGAAQVLCDTGAIVIGGFWTPSGKIIFTDPSRPPGLWEVDAGGGTPSPLAVPWQPRKAIVMPMLLPDANHFLYGLSSGDANNGDIYVGSLNNKQSKKLGNGFLAGYSRSPGDPDKVHLLFARGTANEGQLMAQGFDLRKLEMDGDAVLIAEQTSSVAVSLNGTLAYAPGLNSQVFRPTVFDRQGRVIAAAGEPGVYLTMAFSPDGKRVAVSRRLSGDENLWMIDLARGISTRFTFDSASDQLPTWSPDGSRVAFSSSRADPPAIYEKLSNGGSDEELLFKSDQTEVPLSWSGDGRFLLIGESAAKQIASVLPLDENGHPAGKSFVFVQKGVGAEETFSPGPQGHPRWVAYSSNESGRYEVYVRPFDPSSPTGAPRGGGKWQVSTQGGLSPRWNGNGKELFYVAPDNTVMAVDVSGDHVFQFGTPKPLFKPKGLGPEPADIFFWDASSDGSKFVFSASSSTSASAPLPRFTVVLNWPSLLKK
ncbi:MAG TPA: protein kinase [Candidatus Acidoferrum sp.]|nr:protein kinase [Candidatus Acidoferrum sp.]